MSHIEQQKGHQEDSDSREEDSRRVAAEIALQRARQFAMQNGGYEIETMSGRTEVFIPIVQRGQSSEAE